MMLWGKKISFCDILFLEGGWEMSLAQILIKLETLSFSMIFTIFLIFWRFRACWFLYLFMISLNWGICCKMNEKQDLIIQAEINKILFLMISIALFLQCKIRMQIQCQFFFFHSSFGTVQQKWSIPFGRPKRQTISRNNSQLKKNCRNRL